MTAGVNGNIEIYEENCMDEKYYLLRKNFSAKSNMSKNVSISVFKYSEPFKM